MTTLASALSDRASLIYAIREELVGPRSTLPEAADRIVDDAATHLSKAQMRGPLCDPRHQELRRNPPFIDFGLGVLYAPDTRVDDTETDNSESEPTALQEESLAAEEPVRSRDDTRRRRGDLEAGPTDDDLDIAGCNRMQQSSIGITFAAQLPRNSCLTVELPAAHRYPWQTSSAAIQVNGIYRPRSIKAPNGRELALFRRIPLCVDGSILESLPADDLCSQAGRMFKRTLTVAPHAAPLKLELQVLSRPVTGKVPDVYLITIALVNRTGPARSQIEQHLYQTMFTVTPGDGATIVPFPDSGYATAVQRHDSFQQEEDNLRLLYHNLPAWAIGHGCSATWDWRHTDSPPTHLAADVLPAVELPSMSPTAALRSGEILSIHIEPLATATQTGVWWQPLDTLLSEYANWLKDAQSRAAKVPPRLSAAASRHLGACQDALDRMLAGLALLRSDPIRFEAFRLANLAMLLQQRAQKDLSRRALHFDPTMQCAVPQGTLRQPTDFTDASPKSWRAFQLAFLLMCIGDDADDAWRHCVDLIWFPTGGGKTEAYLAYAAYRMFLERLHDSHAQAEGLPGDGVNVLMRYTLRMLTTQQFQRAGSLICAMEFIRQQATNSSFGARLALAGGAFSLGLWIGGDSSPNRHKYAYERVCSWRRASGGSSGDKNPMVLRECPWCRAELGKAPRPRCISTRQYEAACLGGFHTDAGTKTVSVSCSDPQCPFGSFGATLPIYIIDEDVYERRPSFVIATVDKFAMLPFKAEARTLFGFATAPGSQRVKRAPCLIIQDELHLISGPLGSLFGLYEGLVEDLCSPTDDARPKIICSTATIRGAQQQVRTLFARDTCRLFPPPGLDIGDCFFGTWARGSDGRLAPGRMYLGICAPGYNSALTSQVRSFSACLQAVQSRVPLERRDPWWTLLAFYNSFRDLGGARTLFQSDIPTRLDALAKDWGLTMDQRRPSPDPLELSGRLSQEEVIDAMDLLGVGYGDRGRTERPIGACLASSIIEVGVDVDRLSLMAVVGQPTTTSRYIQVTGRIGRRWWERPGLAIMLYNATRPRDRSHFEQFQSYHQQLYSQVEPTTATPYSDAALTRALHAVLIGYVRCKHGVVAHRWPDSSTSWDIWADSVDAVKQRAHAIQSPELPRVLSLLDRLAADRAAEWRRWLPTDWVEWMPSQDDHPLLHQAGTYFTQAQRQAGWLTPTSMRNVDAQCELAITSKYLNAPQQMDHSQ